MRAREGLVAVSLAAATISFLATGCATDTCACQYPIDQPTPGESPSR